MKEPTESEVQAAVIASGGALTAEKARAMLNWRAEKAAPEALVEVAESPVAAPAAEPEAPRRGRPPGNKSE